jgi:hypothetical protein
MIETRQYTALLALAAFIALGLAAPRLLHKWRRTYGHKVSAQVDLVWYEVYGKTIFALVDLSWHDNGHLRGIKRVPTGRIDIVATPAGHPVEILVHHTKRGRCVFDL